MLCSKPIINISKIRHSKSFILKGMDFLKFLETHDLLKPVSVVRTIYNMYYIMSIYICRYLIFLAIPLVAYMSFVAKFATGAYIKIPSKSVQPFRRLVWITDKQIDISILFFVCSRIDHHIYIYIYID